MACEGKTSVTPLVQDEKAESRRAWLMADEQRTAVC